jgi:predicted dehydrogenase
MKLGIIGTGRIAKRALKELEYVPEFEVVAVYNPNYDHARDFAKRLENAKASPNLEVFGESVDAVYIATPHGTHHHYAGRMLELKKHVLCEKPMVMDPQLAKELYESADRRGAVLMEAIKTAYCPGFAKLEEVVASGVIGDIVDVEAAFTRLTLPGGREFDPGAIGGAFTEFGTYNMLPIFRFLGTDYRDVSFMRIPTASGVDGYSKAMFSWGESTGTLQIDSSKTSQSVTSPLARLATAKCGLTAKSEGQLLITGTKGYILAPSPWWRTSCFEVRYEDPNKVDRYVVAFESDGLRYEFKEFARRISELEEGAELASQTEALYKKEKDEAIARAGVFEKFLKTYSGINE